MDSIQKVLDKEIERKKKAAENIADDAEKKKAENYIKWQETVNKAEVQQAQKKVDAIYQMKNDNLLRITINSEAKIN